MGNRGVFVSVLLCVACGVWSEKIVPIKYGDLDNWTVRYIKESALLGGQTKAVYNIAQSDTISGNSAFVYKDKQNPWAISNVYANVMGVVKGSVSVFPEKRNRGYCARLESKLETVKVAGMLDIQVAVAGSIFLGKTHEPIRNPNNPYKKLDMGVPFTRRPSALLFDYKSLISEERTITKALGFGVSTLEGHDVAEVYMFLQKRWEDKSGNIYAKRVGTAYLRVEKTVTEWQNNYRLPVQYGDITQLKDYKPYKGLRSSGGFCAQNSSGKSVEVHEVGWGDADELPTHVILMFTVGCYPAFHSHIGNKFWIDNVRLVYE